MSKGILYIVATPIGNMEDLSSRAVRVLQDVDLIAAEDTRHSGRLLQHYSVNTATFSLHDHNERKVANSLVKRLIQGESIALISDAGTPLVSDPGYVFVDEAHRQNIRVVPITGASSVIAALSVAGMPTDRFVFEGFLPAKIRARQKKLKELSSEMRTMVFFESPHRILDAVESMVSVFGGDRPMSVARELTKLHEQVVRSDISGIREMLIQGDIASRGEFVLIVRGAGEKGVDLNLMTTLNVLSSELSPSKVASVAHRLTGIDRSELYKLVLSMNQPEDAQ